MDRSIMDEAGLAAARTQLGDWDVSASAISRTVPFATFLAAVDFVSRMAPVAEAMDHHPDLTLSWRTVGITLSTHSAGGVTAADVALARALNQIIDELQSARPDA